MSHPKLDLASLRERTVPLGEDRAEAVRAAVLLRHARHAGRVRVARASGAVLLLAAVVGAGAAVARHHDTMRAMPASAPSEAPTAVASNGANELGGEECARATCTGADYGGVVLGDGSRVTFLAAGTELAQAGTSSRQSTLVRGAARFDVVHDANIPFRVTAGRVVVEDVGTVFTIRLGNDGATFVGVDNGSVSVRGPDGERVLDAGASWTFGPPAAGAPAIASSIASNPAPPAPREAAWKGLARAGDYERAYTALVNQGTVPRDDPEELLLAADTARLAGHPERAALHLRRLIERFPADSRVGLAAFTLGRVLFDDLGQPREAGRAFATAYAHGGPLAEDALAREIEAMDRAGEQALAKDAARRYLAAFPTGRRAPFARRIAESP